MATKEQCDKYAAEMAARFEEFTKWAVENWPNKDHPLLSSDFNESRKEVGLILGSRLSEAQTETPSPPAGESNQYVHLNPAPWP